MVSCVRKACMTGGRHGVCRLVGTTCWLCVGNNVLPEKVEKIIEFNICRIFFEIIQK
jgi:hypothetical protein